MSLVVLCFITVLILLLWMDTRKPRAFPPGPTWMPFIGTLPLIKQLHSSFKFYHLVWDYLSQRYGSIVGLRIGNDKLIIISGYNAIKDFYSRSEFDGRPQSFSFRIRTFGKKLGVVFTENQLWEEQRKFTMLTFKKLGMGKNNMRQHIEEESIKMISYFNEKCKNGTVVEMSNAFDISVLNTMWVLLAGYSFDLNDNRLQNLMALIHKSFRIVDMSGGVLSQFPFLRFMLPEYSGYKPLLRTIEPIWKFLNEEILKINTTLNYEEPRSLIEAFLIEMELKRSETFTSQQLLSLCVDFFQAGSETTSNTLSFGILYMLKNPHVHKKMKNELNNVIGPSRLPCLNDRPNLKYITAVINEIQRISNVAPLAIAHRTLDRMKIQGYIIPKHTCAIISLYSLHMDSKYWGDPKTFRPERFLDINGNLMQHDYFMPFGSGKRRCMGEDFAKSSLFLFFATFIHSFDFELPSGIILPNSDGLDGLTISPKPFKLILKKRL